VTLAARVEDLEPDAVRRALWEERSLVKTWAMRGTLHLLPSDEFPLWHAARSTTRLWETGAWQRGLGVTLGELGRLNDAVAQALDGQLLTREELADRVGELTGSELLGDKLRESWGALLKPAAALGLVCEDFARWWGIPSPARGARLLQRLGEEVARVEVEGTAAYALAADLPGLAEAGGRGKAAGAGAGSRTVRLLPAFDQYVITATLHAEHLMPGPFNARVYRPQGWLSPVLLVGGRMDGVWRQEAKGRRLLVTIEPFAGPPPVRVRRAAEAEAERLAAWSGGQLELRWADAG